MASPTHAPRPEPRGLSLSPRCRRVGADRPELLLCRTERSEPRARPCAPDMRRLAPRCPRRAVAPGELDELGEQVAGVAARSGAPRCRSTPRAVAVESQVQVHEPFTASIVVARSTAARASGRAAMRAPTTSWWWKLTPPRRRPGARLADVVEQRRQPHELAPGRVLATTANVCVSTSLWLVDRVLLEAQGGSSGRNSSTRPVSSRNHRPAVGSSTTRSLSSSSRIRSGTRSRAGRASPRRRATSVGSGSRP